MLQSVSGFCEHSGGAISSNSTRWCVFWLNDSEIVPLASTIQRSEPLEVEKGMFFLDNAVEDR